MQNDGHVGIEALDQRRDFMPFHLWHFVVEHHEVDGVFSKGFQSKTPVVGGVDRKSIFFQDQPNESQCHVVIIHAEYDRMSGFGDSAFYLCFHPRNYG